MIIAVDFDGVLCENKFPQIGEAKRSHINMVKYLISQGHEVILWTSRVEKELDAAVDWCKSIGIEFAAINDNAPSNKRKYGNVYKTPPRKVYADLYIDDHALNYDDSALEYDVMCHIAKEVKLWTGVNY